MHRIMSWVISKIIGNKACVIATLDGGHARTRVKGNVVNLIDLSMNIVRNVIENQVAENDRKAFWEAIRDYAEKKSSELPEEH